LKPGFLANYGQQHQIDSISAVRSLLFGSTTFVNLIFNGVNLGMVVKASFKTPIIIFTLILPHGIFEIPAIIIAGAAGFKIPYEIIRYLAGKKETILTKEGRH